MSTQIIKFGSRSISEQFLFTENGETSWGFVAEGDGAIYSTESQNISSFLINGVTETLPFTVVDKESYVISITKTTPGQAASLKINTRRDVDKLRIYNVPDYGVYRKRFIYCLNTAGDKVYVIDSELMKGANYLGNGSYTTSPIISVISLPNTPNGAIWSKLEFTVVNGSGRIIVCSNGESTPSTNIQPIFSFCYINPDYTVTDLSGTLGQISTFTGTASIPASRFINQPQYDYINNILYINEYYVIMLDLNNNTVSYNTGNRTIGRFLTKSEKMNFNPITQEFVAGHDFSVIDSRFYNWRNSWQTADRAVYSRTNNAYYINANNTAVTILKETRESSTLGLNQTGLASGSQYITTISDELGTSIRTLIQTGCVFLYRLDNIQNNTPNLFSTFQKSSNFLVYNEVEASAYSGLYFLLERTSTNINTRIATCDWNGQVSYIDMPESVVGLTGNGLVV